MSKYKVVITDHEYETIDNEKRILSQIDAQIVDCQTRDESQLIEICKDADAVITQYATITDNIINAMEKCKIIGKYATGIDNVDIAAATAKNICYTNVNEYCTDEVSTHTAALLLEAARHVSKFNGKIKSGEWYGLGIKINSLRNSVIGVIGFGRISKLFIEKMRPFCDNIWVFSDHANPKDVESVGAELKTFDEIVENADYITIHSPLTEKTKHMFNKEVFGKMKNSASIINVARGALVSEKDLIDALRAREIAFAALDVLESEPAVKDNPLLAMDNVVITPHTAWYSEESQQRLQSTPAEDIVRVLSGKKPLNLVNKELEKLFD